MSSLSTLWIWLVRPTLFALIGRIGLALLGVAGLDPTDWLVRQVTPPTPETLEYARWGLALLFAIAVMAFLEVRYRWRTTDAANERQTATQIQAPPATGMSGPLDFQYWNQKDHFAVWQAACLWVEMWPDLDKAAAISSKSYPAYSMLLEEIHHQKITPTKAVDEQFWWELSRKDLRKLAQRKGVKPAFLFSEFRSAVPATEEPPPIEIVYANECNKDHIQSRFKRSTALLTDGQPTKHHITLHEFYVGVRNGSQRTLRNVQMTIEEMNKPPAIVSISCMSETTKTAKVDIPPARLEHFLLGRAYDSSDVGYFSPTFLPPDAIDAIAAKISKHSYVGMFIVAADGQTVPLLKNDGCVLEFAVYADDAPPAHGRITVNARGTLEVLVHGREMQ